MARPLVRGAVKTRLTDTLGEDGALATYERLLRSTLEAAERVSGAALVLAEAPASGETDGLDTADPLPDHDDRWSRLRQHGDGLGDRMSMVIADLFADATDKVVIVGSDSPALPPEYVEQAFVALETSGTVLGPAADGGYYLLGVGREAWLEHGDALSALLRTSPMSDPALLDYTMLGLSSAGLSVTLLPLWVDVDEPDDLHVLDRLEGGSPRRGEPLTELREVYLHLTHRCARNCRHCYDPTASAAAELTTSEWRQTIDQCAALGARSFVFIGGDPLLRHDFTALVDYVTGHHAARARFFFNCRIDTSSARKLARAGRGLLTPLVSVDGPRAINDALRGPGSYDDVMASVAELRAVNMTPVANTVLVRPALPGLPQLARDLRDAGIGRLHLILPHQRGMTVQQADDLVPSGAEMLAAVRELLVVAGKIGLLVDNIASWRRRIGKRNDFCAAGCRELCIDPEGLVHACVITAGDPAFVVGSLRERPLDEIWHTSAGLRLLRATRARDRAECLACSVADSCGGECWVQAHYAARVRGRPAGYTAPFPYCEFVRPLLEELTTTATAVAAANRGAADAGGGQSSAGAAAYSLFDCI